MKKNLVFVFLILLIFGGCQTKEEKAIELHKESLTLLEQNKLEQAEKNLDQALEIGNINYRVLEAKLILYQKQGNQEKLEQAAASLLDLHPSHDAAIEIIYQSHLEKGNRIKALEVLSHSRKDSNQAIFDTMTKDLLKPGMIGQNPDLTVEKSYELLFNRYRNRGKTMATGVALHQLLDLAHNEKNVENTNDIVAFVEEKLSLLEVNVNYDTFEATAGGYRYAASSANKEYATPKELISGTIMMNGKVSSIQKQVSGGKVQVGSSEIRRKIFLHKVISNKLEKIKKSPS